MTNKELQDILKQFPDDAVIVGDFDYGEREIGADEVYYRDTQVCITGY